MAANTKTLRAKIAELQREIERVRRAVPPVAERTELVRAVYRQLTEPYAKFIEKAGDVLNGTSHGELGIVPVSDPASRADLRANMALAAGLAAIGEERFIAEATQSAAERDRGILRMTASQQAETLRDLRCRLYSLELEDEAGVEFNADSRRPGANAAAVLGIPAEVAAKYKFFTR